MVGYFLVIPHRSSDEMFIQENSQMSLHRSFLI